MCVLRIIENLFRSFGDMHEPWDNVKPCVFFMYVDRQMEVVASLCQLIDTRPSRSASSLKMSGIFFVPVRLSPRIP